MLQVWCLKDVVEVFCPARASVLDLVCFRVDVRLILQNIRQPTIIWGLYGWLTCLVGGLGVILTGLMLVVI